MENNEYEITSEELEQARKEASEVKEQEPTPEAIAQPAEGQVEEKVEEQPEVEAKTEIVEEELPEKFRGKSAAEIAKSALEAERRMHEIASERSFERKRAEEYEARVRQLESIQQQPQTDPLEDFDKLWEQDPKEAVKKVHQKSREEQELKRRQEVLQMRAKDAVDYYQKTRTENPDFAQREADMAEHINRFGHLINPEFAQSKETLELLYLASRGSKVDEYSKAAVEKASKQQQLIKEEKRKAASETSLSKGNTESYSEVDNFHNLSPKQQREELRKMRSALK